MRCIVSILFGATMRRAIVFLIACLAMGGAVGPMAHATETTLSSAPLVETSDGKFFRKIDDMLIQVEGGVGVQSVRPRAANLWRGGVLPVEFEDGYRQRERDAFFDACKWWSAISRVKCVDQTTETDFVFVSASDENISYVGRIGGAQDLKLFNRNNLGVIAHEIAHALGFSHQHNAPNRNLFIHVQKENIKSGKGHNFTIIENGIVMGDYDYCSIMHYGEFDFSANGLPTIELLKETGCLVGQRYRISAADKLGMIEAYGPSATDDSLLDVPNLIGSSTGDNGPSEIFEEFGLQIAVIARFDNGKPVSEFPTPNAINTSCFTKVSNQFPLPTDETGVRAPFKAVISITLSRRCIPYDDGHSQRNDLDERFIRSHRK